MLFNQDKGATTVKEAKTKGLRKSLPWEPDSRPMQSLAQRMEQGRHHQLPPPADVLGVSSLFSKCIWETSNGSPHNSVRAG